VSRRLTIGLAAGALAVLGLLAGIVLAGGSSGAPTGPAKAVAGPGRPAVAAAPGTTGGPQTNPATWLDRVPQQQAVPQQQVHEIEPGSPAWHAAIGPDPILSRTSATASWVAMSTATFDTPADLAMFRVLSPPGERSAGAGFRVENGRLRVDLAATRQVLASPMDESGDVRLSFDLEIDPGQTKGDVTVFWGANQPFDVRDPMSIAWNGYEAKLGAMGRAEQKFKRRARETLEISAAETLQKPGSHAVVIEQNGGELRMSIDGVVVLTAMDGEPIVSGQGAQVGIMGFHMTGWIDNWTVFRPAPKGAN
jgi:hypothetical protein